MDKFANPTLVKLQRNQQFDSQRSHCWKTFVGHSLGDYSSDMEVQFGNMSDQQRRVLRK